jgi:DNA recombination protein RmuC
MEMTLTVLLMVALAALALLAARRGGSGARDVAPLLAPLHAELSRLARQQEDLRLDVARSRETSLVRLGDVTREIRDDISEARRALSEVRALEQARVRQMDQAADSLRRLEAIIAGSPTRGAAGERIIERALTQLPPDLLVVNAAFGSKIVEYALRLPDGRLLPIDSKWTSVAALERLEGEQDPAERKRLVEQIARELRQRVREMTKYLDPERTATLGVLAVPDAVYQAAPEVHGEGYREGVLIAPFSSALPLLLSLYRLEARFAVNRESARATEWLREAVASLERVEEEIEGRLSRALAQLENARDALRSHAASARRHLRRVLEASGEEGRAGNTGARSDPGGSGADVADVAD